MNHKAVSGILGGLILIIILVGSLSLLMTLDREQSNLFVGQQSSVSKTLEFSPLVEVYSNGCPELISSSGQPLYIKYLIFPDGKVKDVSAEISSTPFPVSSLVGNYNGWFIAVTNDGEEYNVSDYVIQDPSNGVDEEIGISHAISLKNVSSTQEVENLIDEASSLPFHDMSGAEVVTQQAGGRTFIGLSNVTLIYMFPNNNLTFCIGMRYFTGPPMPPPFGLLFYSGDGYGSSYGHYYYECFYAEGWDGTEEGFAPWLCWESFYPEVHTYFNQSWGTNYSVMSFSHMYRFTQLKGVIHNSYLAFYRISIEDLDGTWYLSIASKGPGLTYNESYAYQKYTHYPVGSQIPITGSPLYELYIFVPADDIIVMQ